MKKIVVMSDNHGHFDHLEYVIDKNKDADLYVHCGDNEGFDEQLSSFTAVKGNNDWPTNLGKVERFTINNHKYMVMHGDYFGYFGREQAMVDFCFKNDVDILITGHTHFPMDQEIDGKRLINPGSTALPRGGSKHSYAIIYDDGDKVSVEFKEVI